jgi:hypothetical protein
MANVKKRTVLIAGLSLIAVWLVAAGGLYLARQARMTPEKVSEYMSRIDFGSLSGEDRAAALQELIDRINALSAEDRRLMRLNRQWEEWFLLMNDTEKSQFVEGTMPVGITQMIRAFEELPEEGRRKTIDNAMKRLREVQTQSRARIASGDAAPISPELEKRMRSIGIQTFLKESTAQSKAEAAVLIEEIQRSMERGSVLR